MPLFDTHFTPAAGSNPLDDHSYIQSIGSFDENKKNIFWWKIEVQGCCRSFTSWCLWALGYKVLQLSSVCTGCHGKNAFITKWSTDI